MIESVVFLLKTKCLGVPINMPRDHFDLMRSVDRVTKKTAERKENNKPPAIGNQERLTSTQTTSKFNGKNASAKLLLLKHYESIEEGISSFALLVFTEIILSYFFQLICGNFQAVDKMRFSSELFSTVQTLSSII